MKELTKFKINPLYRDVVREIIKDSQDYEESTPEESLLARLGDISRHGLSSGIVGRLIYYSDTTAFYRKFKAGISQLLYEMLESTGLSVHELFGDKWDSADPLALDDDNQNLLAWFAYEEIAYQLQCYLEED